MDLVGRSQRFAMMMRAGHSDDTVSQMGIWFMNVYDTIEKSSMGIDGQHGDVTNGLEPECSYQMAILKGSPLASWKMRF